MDRQVDKRRKTTKAAVTAHFRRDAPASRRRSAAHRPHIRGPDACASERPQSDPPPLQLLAAVPAAAETPELMGVAGGPAAPAPAPAPGPAALAVSPSWQSFRVGSLLEFFPLRLRRRRRRCTRQRSTPAPRVPPLAWQCDAPPPRGSKPGCSIFTLLAGAAAGWMPYMHARL